VRRGTITVSDRGPGLAADDVDRVYRAKPARSLPGSGLGLAIVLAQAVLGGESLLTIVQITAVLVGLVPYGLFFLVAVAYVRGAARIAPHGALVQQVSAVKSVRPAP
jgi:histidine kinase/DNA gyrase B/HSP90-like ATPase